MYSSFVRRWIVIGLLAGTALALPLGAALAAHIGQEPDADGDLILFGNRAAIGDGEVVGGDVVVIGGELRLEEGGRVKGDVVVIGGSVEVAGRVDGDLVTIGAALQVEEEARIDGEAVAVGGAVDVDDSSVVAGGFSATPGPVLIAPSGSSIAPLLTRPAIPRLAAVPLSQMVRRLVGAVNIALIVGLLAALVLLVWPLPLERMGQAVTRAPAAAGGVGCLSMLLTPLLAALFAVTLVLVPLTLMLVLAFLIVLLFGWVAVGVKFGERLLAWFGAGEVTTRNAGVAGTFGLTLVTGLVGTLPAVGWLSFVASLLLATVGVGAVVLTRFGGRAYRPAVTDLPGTQLAAENESRDNQPTSTDG